MHAKLKHLGCKAKKNQQLKLLISTKVMQEVCELISNLKLWYSTNQPQLKRDTRAKRIKNACHTCANAKSNFACACVYDLNQWLNGYTVAGSLSVGAS